jgi:hypothetical protein
LRSVPASDCESGRHRVNRVANMKQRYRKVTIESSHHLANAGREP